MMARHPAMLVAWIGLDDVILSIDIPYRIESN